MQEAPRKPFIGITSSFDGEKNHCFIEADCCEAVHRAGGIAIVIPAELEYEGADIGNSLALFDGIILSGGGDLEPWRYGETAVFELDSPSSRRDRTELAIAKRAFDERIPLLGICRGMQVMNVALGGTLHQDLELIPGAPAEIRLHHKQQPPYQKSVHAVSIAPGTMLESLYAASTPNRAKTMVNSMHHQAVHTVSPNMRIAAMCGSVIEAVEARQGHPFYIGVQWHPEYLASDPLIAGLCKAASARFGRTTTRMAFAEDHPGMTIVVQDRF